MREIAGAFRIRAQDEAATPPDEDALAYAQRAVETDGSFALLYQALGEDLLKGARAGDAVKGLLACFSGDPVVPPHTVETLVSVERALRDGSIALHAFPFNSELDMYDASLVEAGVELSASISTRYE